MIHINFMVFGPVGAARRCVLYICEPTKFVFAQFALIWHKYIYGFWMRTVLHAQKPNAVMNCVQKDMPNVNVTIIAS